MRKGKFYVIKISENVCRSVLLHLVRGKRKIRYVDYTYKKKRKTKRRIYPNGLAHNMLYLKLHYYLYKAPKFLHARKSAPSLSIPKEFQTAGRKIFSSSTLCMQTGMRSIEASVMRSAPICP